MNNVKKVIHVGYLRKKHYILILVDCGHVRIALCCVISTSKNNNKLHL